MLTDAERELLTAAVDGELPPGQEPTFRRLLAGSSTASQLYRQLQADRLALASACRYPAPAGFANQVVARVRALPKAAPARPATRRAGVGRIPYIIAASTLLAVSVGTFAITRSDANPESVAVVQRHRLPKAVDVVAPSVTSPSVPATTDANTSRPLPSELVATVPTPSPESAPTPRSPGSADVFAAPIPGATPGVSEVVLRFPLLAPVADFDRDDIRARVKDELTQDAAFRLDLFAKDTVKAVELFQAACKSAGVHLTIEAVAQDRLKKKQSAAWVIYTEALSADDLAALMGKLAILNHGPDAPYSSAHLIPAQAAEAKELKDLLGIDPGLGKRTKTPTPTAPKSISAGTVDQIAASLAKKDKSIDKPALLMAFQPASGRANPTSSKEIRTFLDTRTDRKPTAVPLMITIRPLQ